jgi:hypothetical protein
VSAHFPKETQRVVGALATTISIAAGGQHSSQVVNGPPFSGPVALSSGDVQGVVEIALGFMPHPVSPCQHAAQPESVRDHPSAELDHPLDDFAGSGRVPNGDAGSSRRP